MLLSFQLGAYRCTTQPGCAAQVPDQPFSLSDEVRREHVLRAAYEEVMRSRARAPRLQRHTHVREVVMTGEAWS